MLTRSVCFEGDGQDFSSVSYIRFATIVFRRLRGGMIRVVTARDIDEKERRLFHRK